MKKYNTQPGTLLAALKKKKKKTDIIEFGGVAGIQIMSSSIDSSEEKLLNLQIAREEVKKYVYEIEEYLQQIRGK